MQRRQFDSRLYAVAWLLVASVLCGVVAVWATTLVHAVGPLPPVLESIPTARASVDPSAIVPAIVTDYTNDGTATTAALCAQLSPTPASVTVETPNGKVLQTVDCAATGGAVSGSDGTPSSTSAEPCLYIEAPDGEQTVVSAKTGSLLTPVQAASCSK